MGIEGQPVRSPMMDKNNIITRPWREWFDKIEDALNKTETLDVLISTGPDVTEEITYVDGS